MTTSFTKKRIDVTFNLGQGAFGTSGFKTVKLSGYRVQLDIASSGGISRGELNMRIYGLDLSTMNQLARVGRVPTNATQNQVIIAAGDTDPLTQVYKGSIFMGWADFAGAPDACFQVGAQAGWWEAVSTALPSNYPGLKDVAEIMADLVAKMNKANGTQYVLENKANLSFYLCDQHLTGSYYQQAQQACIAANINIELENDTLAIWPNGGARAFTFQTTPSTPLIAGNGLAVGYPKYNATGITVRTIFNPQVQVGKLIRVQSVLTPATEIWTINTVAHNLDSELPGGNWYTTLECSYPNRLVIGSRS